MTQVPASLTDFARRLLLHEAGDRRSPRDLVDAMERGSLGLHAQLAPLLSSTGFDALVGRAINLAARDFAFLAGPSVFHVFQMCPATDAKQRAIDELFNR